MATQKILFGLDRLATNVVIDHRLGTAQTLCHQSFHRHTQRLIGQYRISGQRRQCLTCANKQGFLSACPFGQQIQHAFFPRQQITQSATHQMRDSFGVHRIEIGRYGLLQFAQYQAEHLFGFRLQSGHLKSPLEFREYTARLVYSALASLT